MMQSAYFILSIEIILKLYNFKDNWSGWHACKMNEDRMTKRVYKVTLQERNKRESPGGDGFRK